MSAKHNPLRPSELSGPAGLASGRTAMSALLLLVACLVLVCSGNTKGMAAAGASSLRAGSAARSLPSPSELDKLTEREKTEGWILLWNGVDLRDGGASA